MQDRQQYKDSVLNVKINLRKKSTCYSAEKGEKEKKKNTGKDTKDLKN